MLRVTLPQKEPCHAWIPVAFASLAVHIALFVTAQSSAEKAARRVSEPSRFAFSLKKAAPSEPERPRRKAPEPKPPEPRPEPEQRRVTRRPRPNAARPEPKKPAAEPVQEIFGVTPDSVAAGSSGPAVRVGNTLEKAMEPAYTPPERVAALPPSDRPSEAPKPALEPVPVYRLTRAPTFETKVEPVYPEQARRAGIQGTVQLEIWLDERGRARKIRVLSSPGHGLDRAAIVAAARSRFTPGLINGKPVPVKITVPYRFVLDA